MGALVDQARTTFLSGGGGHRILLDLPRVMADRQRIVQVLNNLLSNAAAHSSGSTPIRVAVLRDGVQVAISVEDEGRGVPPERLPHLFRKYAGRGDSDRGPETEGSGLGLCICKGLVEAHGAASGPRAIAWVRGHGSPSPSRWRKRLPRRPSLRAVRTRPGNDARAPGGRTGQATTGPCITTGSGCFMRSSPVAPRAARCSAARCGPARSGRPTGPQFSQAVVGRVRRVCESVLPRAALPSRLVGAPATGAAGGGGAARISLDTRVIGGAHSSACTMV